ncbi:MAG: hypothetical protein M1536_07590, partial [Firmicutes bacterium]|nr:hypothetical protein [Bacillota bacterium]
MKRPVLMIFSAVIVFALLLQSSPAFSADDSTARFQKFIESLNDYRETIEARPLGSEEDLQNIVSSGAKIILHANDIFYLTGEHKGELESFKALVSRPEGEFVPVRVGNIRLRVPVRRLRVAPQGAGRVSGVEEVISSK